MNEKIKLQNKEIEIKKLPLGKYADLLKALKTLPTQLGNLAGQSNDEIFAKLPFLIGESLPDVLEIIRIGTDLSEEEVQNLGLDEAIECLMAIAKVNRFGEVWEKVKKGIARFKEMKVPAIPAPQTTTKIG